MAGIFREGIRERLERHPTLRRFFLLAEIALIMAGFIIFFVRTLRDLLGNLLFFYYV